MTEELKADILRAISPLEGWCTPEKANILVSIILDRCPNILVETGIFGGKSAIPIAMGAREYGGILYGIDPWTVSDAISGVQSTEDVDWWSNSVNLEEIYRGFVGATMHWDLGYNLRWLRMSSLMACKCFAERSIGFFHQDSNHSEKVSCQEVELFAPLMQEKSVWVFDDSDWPSTQKAIDMICQLGYGRKSYGKFDIFLR